MPNALRTNMTDLIARVRLAIGDPNPPATGDPVFSDPQIQDYLDKYRVKANYWLLRPQQTLLSGGIVSYRDYYADSAYAAAAVGMTVQSFWRIQDGRLIYYNPQAATLYRDVQAEPVGDWEAGWTLWDTLYNQVIPDTSDEVTGHWTITAGHLPPVYLIGYTYDLNRTCGELCEMWASTLMTSYDFQTDRMGFKRSQGYKMIMQRAASFYARRRLYSIQMSRDDASPI